MKRNTVQMLDSVFYVLNISALTEFDPKEGPVDYFKSGTFELAQGMVQYPAYWEEREIAQKDKIKEQTFQVSFGIKLKFKDSKKHPYSIELMCGGVFAYMAPKPPSNTSVETLIWRSAMTNLYYMSRDKVASITVEMPYGQVYLPTFVFADESPVQELLSDGRIAFNLANDEAKAEV